MFSNCSQLTVVHLLFGVQYTATTIRVPISGTVGWGVGGEVLFCPTSAIITTPHRKNIDRLRTCFSINVASHADGQPTSLKSQLPAPCGQIHESRMKSAKPIKTPLDSFTRLEACGTNTTPTCATLLFPTGRPVSGCSAPPPASFEIGMCALSLPQTLLYKHFRYNRSARLPMRLLDSLLELTWPHYCHSAKSETG